MFATFSSPDGFHQRITSSGNHFSGSGEHMVNERWLSLLIIPLNVACEPSCHHFKKALEEIDFEIELTPNRIFAASLTSLKVTVKALKSITGLKKVIKYYWFWKKCSIHSIYSVTYLMASGQIL